MTKYIKIAVYQAACVSIEATYKPKITFLVVTKHHKTRFFPLDKRDTDRSGNAIAGTCVEKGITHPFEFDFCKYHYIPISSNNVGLNLNVCLFLYRYSKSIGLEWNMSALSLPRVKRRQ